MPILSAFIDLHSVSVFLYKSPKEYWCKNVPYAYSPAIFSSSFNSDTFYESLFESICFEHKVKLSQCDVLLTGFLEPPLIKTAQIPVKLTKSLYEIAAGGDDVYPIVVNNSAICTKDFCYSKFLTHLLHMGDKDETNYYSNLQIYPQMVATDLATQMDIDSNIEALLPNETVFKTNVPLVFCGSRFSQTDIFSELTQILLLNLIKQPGIYHVQKDTCNKHILANLIKMADPSALITIDSCDSGVVISSAYPLECIVHDEDGTSQLIELEKNRLFVKPTFKGQKTKIAIKSRDIGTIEQSIVCGNLGIFFDTREEKHVTPENISLFAELSPTFLRVNKKLNMEFES